MSEDKVESTLNQVKSATENLSDQLSDAADDAKDKAEDVLDDLEDKAEAAGDDFRDALSNFSSALDRLGHATEQKARAEWAEGKPEIDRAVGEVKKGLDGLIRKSTGLIDSLSGRLSKSAEPADATDTGSTEAPEKSE